MGESQEKNATCAVRLTFLTSFKTTKHTKGTKNYKPNRNYSATDGHG
ncbi:MAG: hypothetical protein AB1422_13530 [bacterium]